MNDQSDRSHNSSSQQDSDPLIDSLLEELLGNQEPPDLTQRILAAHEAANPDLRPAVARATSKSDPQPSRYARRSSRYTGWGVACVVVIGGVLFAGWAYQQQQKLDNFNVAQNEEVEGQEEETASPSLAQITFPETSDDLPEGQEETHGLPPWANPDRLRGQIREAESIKAQENSPAVDPIPTPVFERQVPLGNLASDAQMVRLINDELAASWKRARISPTGSINDRVWLQRATRVLVGRELSSQEQEAFAANRDRERFVQQLMASDEFAKHWARQLTEVLVGAADRRKFDRESLEAFVFESIRTEKPWDQLAFELITAQGSGARGSAQNPAVNFVLAHHVDGRKQQHATEKMCQVFLGTQLQCARCHDHPFDATVKQQNYWEMAAFLTQVRREDTGAGVLLVDRDDAGTDGKSPQDADLFYDPLQGAAAVAYAKFPGQDRITTGRVDEVNRRVSLAYAIVESDQFSSAMVNRLWRQVFRQGFTQPVDAMGRHNPPSHPKLLAGLGQEFKNSGYDFRSALRWMVRSAAFDRQERKKNDPLIAKAGADGFSSFAPQFPSYSTIQEPLANAVKSSRRDPTEVAANIAITQSVPPAAAAEALRQINAIHRERLLQTRPGSLLGRLSQDHTLSDQQIVEHLFFALVGRPPTEPERADGETILAGRAKREGLVEIGQIILNSREYNLQH